MGGNDGSEESLLVLVVVVVAVLAPVLLGDVVSLAVYAASLELDSWRIHCIGRTCKQGC